MEKQAHIMALQVALVLAIHSLSNLSEAMWPARMAQKTQIEPWQNDWDSQAPEQSGFTQDAKTACFQGNLLSIKLLIVLRDRIV